MAGANHTVWMWIDDMGLVRYVGSGPFVGEHPALTRWKNRHTSGSPLGKWLAEQTVEPRRRNMTAGKSVSQRDAALIRNGYMEANAPTILDDREPDTWDGGGPSRPIYGMINGQIEYFKSVRAAAAYLALNPSTITRRCQDPRNKEWGYSK
jgi:hypothetical protein